MQRESQVANRPPNRVNSMKLLAFRRWREKLWAHVHGGRVLEVGVGTGKNFSYYPQDAQVTAIDISERMLERARRHAARLGITVEILLMDAHTLAFLDESFDYVVATFVFCSVPDPVLGLSEVRRVCKPTGTVVLLEHMRPESPWLGKLFDLFNPMVVRLTGANINRTTVENIQRAGLVIKHCESLASKGIVKLIVARKH
ncbi:MAG: class I SAM-dependent methyltransferase [Candidatus Bipolaricaulota bacterium]|nr:class I SAM-dependent methyltransferase [Candidatus Bipolaricaulota bacterium]